MTKKLKLKAIFILIIFTLTNSFNLQAQDTIKSVKIGNQVWMTENLNVSRFRNGDPIPEAKTNEEWEKAGQEERPAWCYYDNNPENGKKYGKLYNWYAVNDKRGLAPEGWHIPNIDEFDTLDAKVNKDANALKAIGQGTGNAIGTNTSGFSALFAGGRSGISGAFYFKGSYVMFWSSSEYDALTACEMNLVGNNSGIIFNCNYLKEFGFSVRCLAGNNNIFELEPKYKALLDTTFDNGSNIILKDITKKEHDDLTILGKLWGFLKYYHPAASKGDINWDYELFRIMPKILQCNSKEERNKILADWINSLGQINEKQKTLNIDESKIKFMPDLKWTEDEFELGKDITTQLKGIKIAKRDSSNYYIGRYSTFKHENPYKRMTYPDAGFRLLSLFRYWNIIQYYFPYKNLLEDDWNQILYDFIPEFLKSSNALDYRLTIHKLVEKIHDSHATISGNNRVFTEYLGKYRVACNITFIEDKAVVTEIYTKIDSTLQLKIGDVIEKVNGESVEEIVKRKLPIYSASNYPTKLRNIARDILRSNNEYIPITYSRDGQITTENVQSYKLETIVSASSKNEKKSWNILENNIGYIYQGTIKNSELPEMMKNFQNCKGIIIDFRCYPTDFILESLSKYLMPAPTQFVNFSHTEFDMPGKFIFNKHPRSVGKNNSNYFKGKVVIIVNEITQSTSEFHTMAYRKAPRSTVIGSTTAGADGDVRDITLPGGIKTWISGFGVYYTDGGETQRVGIVPDIEIKPTIKGIIEGRDELLEKAIQIIKDEK